MVPEFRNGRGSPVIVPPAAFTAATVAAIKAAGGTMTGDPRPFRDSGTVLGFAVDPAGNRIELIQRK
jgi:predicted enzyme related to lactoylglutathione lyase